MAFSANAQALINISRKRLCAKASPETRQAWTEIKKAIADVDPVMTEKMVPECVYRSFCPECGCCGYVNTKNRQKVREEYGEVG